MKKRQILWGILALIMAVSSAGCNITGVPQNYCTVNITDPISNKQFSINIDANGLLNDDSNIIGIRTDKDINALCENINNCNDKINATVVDNNTILLYNDSGFYYVIQEAENLAVDYFDDYTPKSKDEKLYALGSETTNLCVYPNSLSDLVVALFYNTYLNDYNDEHLIYYPYHLFDTSTPYFNESIAVETELKSDKEILEEIYNYYYSNAIYDTSYEDIFGSETLYCIKVHQFLYSDDDFTFYIYYDSTSPNGIKYSLIPPETYIEIQQTAQEREDACYKSKGHIDSDISSSGSSVSASSE